MQEAGEGEGFSLCSNIPPHPTSALWRSPPCALCSRRKPPACPQTPPLGVGGGETRRKSGVRAGEGVARRANCRAGSQAGEEATGAPTPLPVGAGGAASLGKTLLPPPNFGRGRRGDGSRDPGGGQAGDARGTPLRRRTEVELRAGAVSLPGGWTGREGARGVPLPVWPPALAPTGVAADQDGLCRRDFDSPRSQAELKKKGGLFLARRGGCYGSASPWREDRL